MKTEEQVKVLLELSLPYNKAPFHKHEMLISIERAMKDESEFERLKFALGILSRFGLVTLDYFRDRDCHSPYTLVVSFEPYTLEPLS